MGQKSGFFTSENGDRKYDADWLARYISGIVSNGVYTTELTTTGENGDMSVTVSAGRAWINGYMYANDTSMTLSLETADGALSRTDLVVLRLDMSNRQITLAIVPGTFGGNVPEVARTADIYELELAQVSVAAGTTAITQEMITDKRADETVCGIVAGAVTQLSTGELLKQLKAGFDTWFANVKGQLSTDAAGHLQNEIDQVASDVAHSRFKLLASYTTAGSYTFTVPDGIVELGAFIIGGGGSGAAAAMTNSGVTLSGGGSGHSNRAYLDVNAGDAYPLVVGAGGARISTSDGNAHSGNNGSSSSFNGVIAHGGSGGVDNSIHIGAEGGQGSSPSEDYRYSGIPQETILAFGQTRTYANDSVSSIGLQGNTSPNECVNPFDGKRILMAGGRTRRFNGEDRSEIAIKDDYGNIGSAGIYTSLNVQTVAVRGTSWGCGGGAASNGSQDGILHYAATSAAGADGAVLIYGR